MPENESTFTVGPSLRGRTAVVTGASRGIGLAIAEQLVRDGARVVITARKQDALDEAVERLGGPEHALAVAGRTDDAEHRAATVRAAVETFGSLDLLVNNTGINPAYGPLMELDLDAARKIAEVNCVSALGWVQAAHAAWLGEHGGAIVNVASVAACARPPASRSTAPARRCCCTSPRSSRSSSAPASG